MREREEKSIDWQICDSDRSFVHIFAFKFSFHPKSSSSFFRAYSRRANSFVLPKRFRENLTETSEHSLFQLRAYEELSQCKDLRIVRQDERRNSDESSLGEITYQLGSHYAQITLHYTNNVLDCTLQDSSFTQVNRTANHVILEGNR